MIENMDKSEALAVLCDSTILSMCNSVFSNTAGTVRADRTMSLALLAYTKQDTVPK